MENVWDFVKSHPWVIAAGVGVLLIGYIIVSKSSSSSGSGQQDLLVAGSGTGPTIPGTTLAPTMNNPSAGSTAGGGNAIPAVSPITPVDAATPANPYYSTPLTPPTPQPAQPVTSGIGATNVIATPGAANPASAVLPWRAATAPLAQTKQGIIPSQKISSVNATAPAAQQIPVYKTGIIPPSQIVSVNAAAPVQQSVKIAPKPPVPAAVSNAIQTPTYTGTPLGPGTPVISGAAASTRLQKTVGTKT